MQDATRPATTRPQAVRRPADAPRTGLPPTGHEDGSMVAEYGLVAVLGATVAGVAISWAKGGAVASLLSALLRHARGLVGA